MTTYAEITTQIADQWVAALKTAEETVAKLSENAQRVVEAIPTPSLPAGEPFAKLNEVLSEHLPKPSEIVEANFEFTNRLLTAQRDLTLKVLEAAAASSEKVAAAAPAPKAAKKA
ncbi:hypothetical protein GCM10028801_41730 [Nocardioides maradonensis]